MAVIGPGGGFRVSDSSGVVCGLWMYKGENNSVSSGVCERWNQTILRLLNKLPVAEQPRWRRHLPELIQAHNCTPHSSTRLSPFWVLFGRQPRLPVDQRWGVSDVEAQGLDENWIQHHRRQSWNACELVERGKQRRQEGDERYRDPGHRGWTLAPGEQVLLRNFRRRKVAPYWQPGPWVVVKQRDFATPVFQIRPEGKEGPVRTIHRRHLRPCPMEWRKVVAETGDECGRASVGPRRVPFVPLGWPGRWGPGPAQRVEGTDDPQVNPPVLGEGPPAIGAGGGNPEVEVPPATGAGDGSKSGEEDVVGASPPAEPLRRSSRVNLGVKLGRYRE